MKRIVVGEETINLQDLQNLVDGEEVELDIGGRKIVKKIKHTELFQGEVVRIFSHKPNSYEWGPTKSRHKIHYYSEEDGLKKVRIAKKIAEGTEEGGEKKDVVLGYEEVVRKG